jgi:hypothetical protein
MDRSLDSRFCGTNNPSNVMFEETLKKGGADTRLKGDSMIGAHIVDGDQVVLELRPPHAFGRSLS